LRRQQESAGHLQHFVTLRQESFLIRFLPVRPEEFFERFFRGVAAKNS
jgi:hypothetical protein